jgi:hypothetical protein
VARAPSVSPSSIRRVQTPQVQGQHHVNDLLRSAAFAPSLRRQVFGSAHL